jgi:hypothetical protein
VQTVITPLAKERNSTCLGWVPCFFCVSLHLDTAAGVQRAAG